METRFSYFKACLDFSIAGQKKEKSEFVSFMHGVLSQDFSAIRAKAKLCNLYFLGRNAVTVGELKPILVDTSENRDMAMELLRGARFRYPTNISGYLVYLRNLLRDLLYSRYFPEKIKSLWYQQRLKEIPFQENFVFSLYSVLQKPFSEVQYIMELWEIYKHYGTKPSN